MVTYKQSSDSLYDFAEGKTPTNSVTLAKNAAAFFLSRFTIRPVY